MTDLARKIEAEYRRRGDQLGWRFLYSPEHVLKSASVAFIGLNPGGRVQDEDHAQFAMKSGSAYEIESWAGSASGRSPLQVQVLALFDRLNVPAEDVLAGNLVPFRSPTWADLSEPSEALEFGAAIWADLLLATKPQTIVLMGSAVFDALAPQLELQNERKYLINWGKTTAARAETPWGRLLRIPHLSRFGFIKRPASQDVLRRLLA